jgi:HK97 family phage portal protein
VSRLQDAWQALTGRTQSRDLAGDEILGWRQRPAVRGRTNVSQEQALRHSGWWACLRLRADLVSMMPIDAYRTRDGYQIPVTAPDLLREPSPGIDIAEHMYSSEFDLGRYGNSVGIITSRTALGFPATIELAPMADTTARMRGYRLIEWRVCGEKYTPDQIWHEKQYTVGGMPLGLSPLGYAAWTVSGYLSAQEFALDWFGGGARPSGTLKNTNQTLTRRQREIAKADFRASVENGDILVHGSDWEWTPAQQDAASSGFLESQNASLLDTCRYLGVPGDMIDADRQTGSITYANVTQRNLQLMVINLGPQVHRRERKWSTALPKPRFVKLNTDAILRMDPATREEILLKRVAGNVLANSEARALNNLPPFTDEQLAEISYFAQLKAKQPQPAVQAGSLWEVPA